MAPSLVDREMPRLRNVSGYLVADEDCMGRGSPSDSEAHENMSEHSSPLMSVAFVFGEGGEILVAADRFGLYMLF